MKRHYSNYFKGINHFKEYKTKLVTTFELSEIMEVFDFLEKNIHEFEMSH
jgi:hypothetical protein